MNWPGLKSVWQRVWEGRTSLENPQTPLSFPAEWLMDIFNGGRTDAGLRVSQLTALQIPDVLACVTRISGAIASQPIRIFERVESGIRHSKRLALEHPLFDVLRYRPNDEMTRATFVRTFVCHLLLWGNGYAEIQRDKGGRPVAIWPRNPVRTRPRRLLKPFPGEPDNLFPMVYITTEGMEQMDQNYAEGVTGVERAIRKEDMLHVPGLALDARLGQDVVYLSRQAMGLALAAEKYAAKFFGNGTTPSGVLETPQALKKETRDALRNMWMESQGGENVHRPAVLEAGLKFTKISSTPSEAQMIEARKQQRSEIAAIFGMPVTMLGESGAARANAEQVALEFVNYTLQPWVAAIEEELKVKLFTPVTVGRNAGKTYIALIDMRDLKLPDATAKKNYYSAARQWGWSTPNEILEMEDENPIPGALGESYLVPVNMTCVDADGKVILTGKVNTSPNAPSSPASIPGQGVDQPKKPEKDSMKRAVWPAFRDAFGRFAARESRNYKAINLIFRSILMSINIARGVSDDGIEAQLRSFEGFQPEALRPENVGRSAREHFEWLWDLRAEGQPRLFLARHGQTDDDASGVSDDYRPEEPLNAEGEGQAKALAGYIAANVSDLASVFSGTPKRHTQTAEAISSAFYMDTRLDPQGQSESEADFTARVTAGIDALWNAHARVLLVTSHRAIKAYARHVGSGAEDIGFCSLWAVGADGAGMTQIFRPGA